jgi:CBS domain-containing protein
MERTMKAHDIMVSPVITVKPATTVKELARILLTHRISGVPVVDDHGRVVGMVSEGDLIHRAEAGTERQRSWWLVGITGERTLADEYVKARGRTVGDVMTRSVISAAPDTPLGEIALLLEKHGIKRVPIMGDGTLVGIVSRANLVQAVATAPDALNIPLSDTAIRERLLGHLKEQHFADATLLNVTVSGGVVNLWGFVNSDSARRAIRLAAETIPGVQAVRDNLAVAPLVSAA